jgi:hypothetical protein
MLEIIASAYPTSALQNAEFAVESQGFNVRLIISAGGDAFSALQLPPNIATADVELAVKTAQGRVAVNAKDVPVEGQIHLIGVNPGLFLGIIRHNIKPQAAANCSLRCNPQSTPVIGPTCIECDNDGLIFKVCC